MYCSFNFITLLTLRLFCLAYGKRGKKMNLKFSLYWEWHTFWSFRTLSLLWRYLKKKKIPIPLFYVSYNFCFNLLRFSSFTIFIHLLPFPFFAVQIMFLKKRMFFFFFIYPIRYGENETQQLSQDARKFWTPAGQKILGPSIIIVF